MVAGPVLLLLLTVVSVHRVYCIGEIRVNLTMGQTERDGVVMIQENGVWGPACGVGFGKKEADVTCRHLGYDHGDALCCRPYGDVAWEHHTGRSIRCHGNETALHHCTHKVQESSASDDSWWWTSWATMLQPWKPEDTYCNGNDKDYAAVVCRHQPAPAQSDFKLSIAGVSSFSGRVVVTYDGVEGGVCAEGWNQQAADRACRDLGFQHGTNYSHVHPDWESQALGPVWTANVSCEGVSSFQHCKHAAFGTVSSCHHYAAVLCYNDYAHSNKGYPYYRLSEAGRGRVEVYLDGQWGTLSSDHDWTTDDLTVLCTSMGFSAGRQDESSKEGGQGPVWEMTPNCVGTEKDLMHCKAKEGWTKANRQDHGNDLHVVCFHTVMLKHGVTHHDGIVLIQPSRYPRNSDVIVSDDDWRPVCYEDFNINDAKVICRELGFADGVPLCCGEVYGYLEDLDDANDLGDNWFLKRAVTRSNCTGTEGSLADCATVTGITWTCTTYVAVSCFGTVAPKDYMLSLRFNDIYYAYGDYVYNDEGDYYDAYYYYDPDAEKLHNQTWGAVSVLYNGLSGHICADGWSDEAAEVACKELGFPHGQKYLHSNYYDSDYIKERVIWSSNFHCTGSENRLSECRHDGWGHTSKCQQEYAHAGVFCYKDEGVKYRIYNPDPQAPWGRVEIMLPNTNTWGTLCRESWNDDTAQVVCRMFGYKSGTMYWVHDLPPSQGTRYQRYEECEGHEQHLEHCVHEGFVPAYDCSGTRQEAGVHCVPYEHHHHPNTTTTKPAEHHGSHNTDKPPSSPSSTTSPSPSSSSSSSSVNVGGIVGGVLAAVVVVGGVVAGVVLWRRGYLRNMLPPYLRQNNDPTASSGGGDISGMAHNPNIDRVQLSL